MHGIVVATSKIPIGGTLDLDDPRPEIGQLTLDGVGAIVIECTVLPQFREVIREYTAVPIFEVGSIAASLLA